MFLRYLRGSYGTVAHLGQKLRFEREQRQWTQKYVADEIDTNAKSVGRWERGEAYPSSYYRLKLCDLFKRTPVELGFTEGDIGGDTRYTTPMPSTPPRIDWGAAPHIEKLYGRENESTQIENWILEDECRIVSVLGTGGIGKTAVTVSVVKQVERNFEYVFWRSLQNAPPFQDVLQRCLLLLSGNQLTDFPDGIENQIAVLIEYLRKNCCLLILDNLETILQVGNEEGQWREGYEGYGNLLKRVGEAQHQSCLILTSRERPKELILSVGKDMRLLHLKGLETMEGKEIYRTQEYLVLRKHKRHSSIYIREIRFH